MEGGGQGRRVAGLRGGELGHGDVAVQVEGGGAAAESAEQYGLYVSFFSVFFRVCAGLGTPGRGGGVEVWKFFC